MIQWEATKLMRTHWEFCETVFSGLMHRHETTITTLPLFWGVKSIHHGLAAVARCHCSSFGDWVQPHSRECPLQAWHGSTCRSKTPTWKANQCEKGWLRRAPLDTHCKNILSEVNMGACVGWWCGGRWSSYWVGSAPPPPVKNLQITDYEYAIMH